uniref:NAD-dependent protein deacylase n=2 Tax=Plectus sambesii TaxID=2011161 RepID=A0A914WYQ1_9BILA
MSRPSSDLASFRSRLKTARHIVVLTGAGISAESGIPTFRGAGGLWRKYEATRLATPQAFAANPALVWEFYHYRREVCLSKEPNDAHRAIAECQKRLASEGKDLTVITQNVDDLHHRAGTTGVLQLHGSLYRVRCTSCKKVWDDRNSPICEALADKGAPDPDTLDAEVAKEDLPHCPTCGGLARPHIVWFGENLDPKVLDATQRYLDECDLCLVIGTSSVVYPAAMFAPMLAARGVPVAEFNIEETGATAALGYHFAGPAAKTVPEALKAFESNEQ